MNRHATLAEWVENETETKTLRRATTKFRLSKSRYLWPLQRIPSAKRRKTWALSGGLDRPAILTCLRHREQAGHPMMVKWAIEVAALSKLARSVIIEPAGPSTAN
jgi:hypothetical protein